MFWSGRSHELFYTAGQKIMVAPYSVKGDTFVSERPRMWTQLPPALSPNDIDIAPDGKRFLVAVPSDDPQNEDHQRHLVFVLNFFDELRDKVPIK